ncbi:Transposon Ty3-I Gag-Pol polyprotein [Nymphaea thermarum]|nr:Transposon Ty3-I Gag-Pol polyprotein [Nymphaea thermarum]
MHGMDLRLNAVDARLEAMMVEQQAMSALLRESLRPGSQQRSPNSDQTQSDEHREHGWPVNGGSLTPDEDGVFAIFRRRPRHSCRRLHMYLMEENDEPLEADTDPSLTSEPETMETQTTLEISLHALASDEVPHLMRVEGRLRGRPVSVLIDMHSTHNFFCKKSARALGCHMEAQTAFDVVVGDGSTLRCRGKCQLEKLEIQGFHFSVQLYILVMAGADLMLGIQWLRELGDVVWDFVGMKMQFRGPANDKFTLEASPMRPCLEAPTARLMKGSSTSFLLFSTQVQAHTDEEETRFRSEEFKRTLQEIIQEFRSVFSAPKSLLPERGYEHHIELQPSTTPVKSRPYRYNRVQRETLKELVRKMLKIGVIQPSRSPFASPALLVKKKDGSWRFCVDYHTLNAITIKDRYPILMVEDLLDELYGACVLLKKKSFMFLGGS